MPSFTPPQLQSLSAESSIGCVVQPNGWADFNLSCLSSVVIKFRTNKSVTDRISHGRCREMNCKYSMQQENTFSPSYSYNVPCKPGAGIAWWLAHWTRDPKDESSNPGRSGGRIFFARINFFVLTLIRYLFHPRVTAVARERPQSFCQKCRW